MEDVDTRALFEEKERERIAYNVKDLQLVLPPHAHAHPAAQPPHLKYECIRCLASFSYKVPLSIYILYIISIYSLFLSFSLLFLVILLTFCKAMSDVFRVSWGCDSLCVLGDLHAARLSPLRVCGMPARIRHQRIGGGDGQDTTAS
jgi:hypothetical protein